MPPTLSTPIIEIVLAIFFILVACISIQRSRKNLFHPLVLVGGIFTYYILVPSLYLLATGEFRIKHPDGDNAALFTTLCVLITTYVAIVAGYDIFATKTTPHVYNRMLKKIDRDDADGPISESISISRICPILSWIGTIAIIIGGILYFYYVFKNGGVVRLLTVRPRTAFQTVPETGRYKFLATSGIYAGMITTFVGLRPHIKRRSLSKIGQVGVFVFVVFALLVAISFRSRMNLAVVGGFILIYLYTAERISKRAIIGATALLVVFGLSFSFFERILTAGEISLTLLIDPFVSNIRLEIFMEVIRKVPHNHPYQFGRTLWWVIPIPGGVPWAPPRMGNQIESIVFGHKGNLYTAPALFVSEMWLNFGLVGTLLAGVVYGAILSIIQYVQNKATNTIVQGIAPLLLLTVISALPTSFQWAIRSMGFRLVVPVLFAVVAAYAISPVIPQRLQKTAFHSIWQKSS